MTTPEQRAALLALAEDSTPKPWEKIAIHIADDNEWHFIVGSQSCGKVICSTDLTEHDAAYIAAACNLAPELAREVGELRNAIADLVTYYVQRRNSLASEVMKMTDKVKEFANNTGMSDLIPKDF